MLQRTWRKSPELFKDFNTLQFASVVAIAVFVPLLIFMNLGPNHHSVSADLPAVSHPVSIPGALRDDAMKITVMRDGQVYFGTDQVMVAALPGKIADRLKDRSVERKVYVVADMRARWGVVMQVLDGVRSAGV